LKVLLKEYGITPYNFDIYFELCRFDYNTFGANKQIEIKDKVLFISNYETRRMYLPPIVDSSRATLYHEYCKHVKIQNDQHLPILAMFSRECTMICEFGQHSNYVSWGFLWGLANNKLTKYLYCVPGLQFCRETETLLNFAAASVQNISFKIIKDDPLSVKFKHRADLLYINAINIENKLKLILDTHEDYVNKYILISGTSVSNKFTEHNVQTFAQEQQDKWQLFRDFKGGNGLCIFTHISQAQNAPNQFVPMYDRVTDEYMHIINS
jgi:hypothetical protein